MPSASLKLVGLARSHGVKSAASLGHIVRGSTTTSVPSVGLAAIVFGSRPIDVKQDVHRTATWELETEVTAKSPYGSEQRIPALFRKLAQPESSGPPDAAA